MFNINNMWQKCFICILVVIISGCHYLVREEEAAPVIDLRTNAPVTHGYHIVESGESLYSIAWMYNRDYRDIALANNIQSPDKIYPGQKLTLKEPNRNRSYPSIATSLKRENSIQRKTDTHAIKKIETPPKTALVTWQWPVKGKIIKTYIMHGSIKNKGIDIAGKLGTPISAAAGGKVVYSGMGLRGYGQLIIIKHNETYLSAYAHNSKLLVKEGQTVKQGQAIALMGQTDSDQVKLHFEIRKNGQPINPLDLLES